MSLHVDESKYNPIAAQIVESDIAFADFLKTAIENKDLKQTLTLCAKKAKQNQGKHNFTDLETAELAYEIFLIIFEQLPMASDLKQKMAATVLDKFKNAVPNQGSPTTTVLSSIPPSPTISTSDVEINSPSTTPTPTPMPRPIPSISNSPTASPKLFSTTSTPLPTISPIPTPAPLPKVQTPPISSDPISEYKISDAQPIKPKLFSSLPLSNSTPPTIPSIESQLNQPKSTSSISSEPISLRPRLFTTTPTSNAEIKNLPAISMNIPSEQANIKSDIHNAKSIAQKEIIKDAIFESNLKNAIETKNLKQNLALLIEKTQDLQNKLNFGDEQLTSVGYELFYEVFQNFSFNPEQKEKMLNTVQSKLKDLFEKIIQSKSSTQPTENPINVEKIAQSFLISDLEFRTKLKTAIETKNLADTLEMLGNQAINNQEISKSNLESRVGFANALFQIILKEIPIDDNTKQKMTKTVLEKISHKLEALVPVTSPTMETSSMQLSPKIFKSVFGKSEDQTTISENQSSNEVSEDEKLRLERETLRKQRQTEKAELKIEKSGDLTTGFNPIEVLQQWLRSDGKFIEIVANIKQIADNAIKINFDPDSEGLIPYIDLKWDAKRYGTYNVIKIEASAPSTKKYPINIVVAHTGKKFVAASLDDEKIDDIPALVKKAQEVNFKNQLQWDQLMAIINNDKYLFKGIDKLLLNNPASGVKEVILVPLILKQDVPTSKIILNTFLSPNLKPSQIFMDVMEQLAEDVDKMSGDDMTSSFSSRFSAIDGTGVKDFSGYQFRYLEKDSQVSFKTCPHCGRPYPNPDADYRRCPNCLAKLK